MEPVSQQEDIIMNIVFKHDVTIGLTQKLSDQLDKLIIIFVPADQADIVEALKQRADALEKLTSGSPSNA